jgi:NADH-quinone oxidoreductase subunit B
MERPVQYNNTVKFEGIPEGYMGEGFMATNFEKVVGLARKNSIWPLPFATSCCGIEFMATMASHYDLATFGSERVGFSPRQCDLLMVMGTIAKKMGPVLRQVYIANGGTTLGNFCGCLCQQRRYFRYLFRTCRVLIRLFQ